MVPHGLSHEAHAVDEEGPRPLARRPRLQAPEALDDRTVPVRDEKRSGKVGCHGVPGNLMPHCDPGVSFQRRKRSRPRAGAQGRSQNSRETERGRMQERGLALPSPQRCVVPPYAAIRGSDPQSGATAASRAVQASLLAGDEHAFSLSDSGCVAVSTVEYNARQSSITPG
jgi:hypothetical protein